MSALLSGGVLAAVALVFVLWPLLRSHASVAPARRREERSSPRDSAVRALREIEFDRATGKLGDEDYAELKRDYTERALSEMREAATPEAAVPGSADGDRAESLIKAARSAAVTCGHCETVCPEPDAAYCSTCGWYLRSKCGKCSAEVNEAGARFCASCGWELAA